MDMKKLFDSLPRELRDAMNSKDFDPSQLASLLNDGGSASRMVSEDLKIIETAKQRSAEEKKLAPQSINFRPLFLEQALRAKTRKDIEEGGYGFSVLRTFCGDEKYCSKVPLKQLQRINLEDMQVRKRHTGKYLLCRVASLPYITVAIHIIVVSPCGNCLLCSIYNYPTTPPSLLRPSSADLDAIFPVGATIAIKEPWVKMSIGEGPKAEMLRVDSPSDIVFIDEQDPLLKGIFWDLGTPALKTPLKTAEEWKTRGNKLFSSKQYLPALREYSLGIKQHPSLVSSYLLYSNRAQTYLHLERYSSCVRDCDAVLAFLRESSTTIENGNTIMEKVLFRRATALYSLRRWETARVAYLELAQLFTNPDYNNNAERATQRIRESTTGQYDIAKLYKEADKSPTMDVADYYGNIAVVRMEDRGGGRGVRTTKDVDPGEILLATKASSYGQLTERPVYSFNLELSIVDTPSEVAVRNNAIYKLCDQPELARGYYSLYPGPGRKLEQSDISFEQLSHIGESETATESPIDADYIEKVVMYNAFTSAKEHSERHTAPSCIFIGSSLINHSCAYNAKWTAIGDFQIIRAIEKIPANTEVFIPYVGDTEYNERMETLAKFVGECKCSLCEDDRRDGHENLKQRAELHEELTSSMNAREAHNSVASCKKIIKKRQDLLNKIISTYRPERNSKPALFHAYAAISFSLGNLASLTGNTNLWQQVIQYNVDALISLGVEIDTSKGDLPIKRGPRYYHTDAIRIAVRIANIHLQLGRKQECKRWMKAAVWVHEIAIGGGKEVFIRCHGPILEGAIREYL